jgi:hypothetical protein
VKRSALVRHVRRDIVLGQNIPEYA